MRMTLSDLIVALAGGTLLVASACSSKAADAAAIGDEGTFVVVRGDLPITLTENGTLVAKDSRQVRVESSRGGKISWLVDAGKEVAEGDVLCRLDPTELNSSIQQSELDITQAEADLKNAQTELDIQQTENVASLEKARIAEDKADKELQRYKEGDGPQERRKLLIAVKDAQTEFERKKKFFDDSKTLVEQGYLKRSELIDHEIAFEKAQVQLEGSDLDLKMFDQYKHPMSLAEKQTALADAKREVGSVEKRNESKLLQRQVAVAQNEKRLLQYKERLRRLKSDLEKFTLSAPCAGIVLHGDPKQPWYRDQIKVGSEVWEGSVVCTIPDLRVMQVKLQVHEADINKLKKGLKTTITMESMPGVVMAGELTNIASIANTGGEWGGGGGDAVKKFDVEVTIEQREGVRLRPGISAKVVIDIDHLADVAYVPLQSVVVEGSTHGCFVAAANGQAERRVVEVGASNDNYIQIQNGLEPGERVLLYNPSLGKQQGDSQEAAGDRASAPAGAGEPAAAAAAGAGNK
ncbi:MAG: efflux RND transporter periplasmic adaptor subunit [Planctomycetota bacterium]